MSFVYCSFFFLLCAAGFTICRIVRVVDIYGNNLYIKVYSASVHDLRTKCPSSSVSIFTRAKYLLFPFHPS
uniref:Putative secreted protein n=1 Tax=Ixodes ricinus TaxID=34613 RepID=A0A6B0U0B5_IXORI